MSTPELEDLYRLPSHFEPEVLDAAKQWADRIRPGLKDLLGEVEDLNVRNDTESPIDRLANDVVPFGVTSNQSIAELPFIGMQLSREQEMPKGGK